MALTEEERKLARAYNIGFTMSTYEPRLLDKIIKASPKNQFIKMMAIGRDHHEFHAGIPRKDHNREFKNGYYNGRTLATHEPHMIDRMMSGKGLNSSYKRGLEAAKMEHRIRTIQQRMSAEPKGPSRDLRRDENFQNGFKIGYRLGADMPFLTGYLQGTTGRYSKFLDGVKSGQEQHSRELAKLKEKNPNASVFPKDPQNSVFKEALIKHKIMLMDEVANNQTRMLSQKDEFKDMPIPKWLEPTVVNDKLKTPTKDKGQKKDIDLDR